MHEHRAKIDDEKYRPGVRELLIYGQLRYFNAQFLGDYMNFGWKFAWMGELESAVHYNTATSMFEVNSDLAARLIDINAYTLSSDFLNKYPALRGHAPQFESSIQLYNPSDAGWLFKAVGKRNGSEKDEIDEKVDAPPLVSHYEATSSLLHA